jgi:hypothetical protein
VRGCSPTPCALRLPGSRFPTAQSPPLRALRGFIFHGSASTVAAIGGPILGGVTSTYLRTYQARPQALAESRAGGACTEAGDAPNSNERASRGKSDCVKSTGGRRARVRLWARSGAAVQPRLRRRPKGTGRVLSFDVASLQSGMAVAGRRREGGLG